jgi:hypothetical protein
MAGMLQVKYLCLYAGNHWYACKDFQGQKDVNILDVGMAAVLQAQLPNPLYMKGAVGGHYSVLGGLVKGNCIFQVEIGEQCVITNTNVLDGISVISDITPRQGTNDVDVFSSPQVTFNYEIDKEFELTDIDNSLKNFVSNSTILN